MARMLVSALSAALAFTVAPVSAQTASGSFERTLEVTGTVEMTVVSGSGDIVVRSGGDGTVQVRGKVTASRGGMSSADLTAAVRQVEQQPPIVQQGNTIRIGELSDDLERHVSIDYDITVPAATMLKAKSGSGDVTVEGLSRDLDLSSGSGDLHASRVPGVVGAASGSGDIRLEATGAVRVSTGSGDIVATGVNGAVTAKTGSGDVRLELTGGERSSVSVSAASGEVRISGARGTLDVETASGDVSVDGVIGGAWSVSTASGNVELSLPAEAAFSLDARSQSGHIETSAPVKAVGTLSPRELKGDVHGGGPRLQLRTASGSITIR